MDGIIINELSLNGQFLDSRDFWKTECLRFTRHCRMPFHMEWGICSNKEVFCCASHARQDFTRFADSTGNPYHR